MQNRNIVLLGAVLTLWGTAYGTGATGTTMAGRYVQTEYISPNIIKVSNAPTPADIPAPQVVTDYSESVAGSPLRVHLDGGILSIFDNANGTVLRDNGERPTANGKYRIDLITNNRTSYYGGGERGHKLNLRGDTLVNYNRQNYGYTGNDPRISQMNITMPLILSPQGFAILFDDFAASTTIAGDTISYITEAPVAVSYYYIGGVTTLAELTREVTKLTGRQPLTPLWAMGYITSKYGYKTADEVMAVADTFATKGYPLDGMVLDLYWFGREQDMGRLEWDRTNWPDPAAMLAALKERNINMITVSEPYVLRNGLALDNFNTLSAAGMFVNDSTGNTHDVTIWVGEGGMFDVSNPATRQWLRNRYKQLTDTGVEGWWGDLGEPEVHPESGYHANGLTARQYHNRYGNDWSSIISELYAEQYPDRRLMTLMRGGTTGLQRHSVFPWSTDVSRSWGGLEPQVRIMLNSGLSGLGYMSSDLGGFAVDEANPYMPELYVRWVEMGLFSPVFRTHAQQYAEPYHYPQYEDILLALVKERYRWLPYNYTLAYLNATEGAPLVRPLDFDRAGRGDYDNISDEYLWGPSVLVAPVMAESAVTRNIVFPAGSDWVDMYAPTTMYSGGSERADYPAPLSKIPHFARNGSYIALADYSMSSTADYRNDLFTVYHYNHGNAIGTGLLYTDDYTPRALSTGHYVTLEFTGNNDGATTVTTVSRTGGDVAWGPQTMTLTFNEYSNRAARTVSVDGTNVSHSYDAATGCNTFEVILHKSNDYRTNIKIEY